MRTRILLSAAGLAMFAAVTGCAGVSSSTGGTSPSRLSRTAPLAEAACSARQLKISLVRGRVEGGVVSGDIGFTDISGTPCRLSGWPDLAAVTAEGRPQAARHVLSTEFGPRIWAVPAITLAPGSRAEAVFTLSDDCASGRPATYRRLVITAPGTADSVSISAYLPYLGAYPPACGPLGVTPVAPSAAFAG